MAFRGRSPGDAWPLPKHTALTRDYCGLVDLVATARRYAPGTPDPRPPASVEAMSRKTSKAAAEARAWVG